MNTFRTFIRLMALAVGLAIAGFYCYVMLTDVTQKDLHKALDTYASKCRITGDETIRLFSYIAANAAKVPVADLQDKLASEFKVRAKQGNTYDIAATTWFQIEKAVGYDHEQRAKQVAMKAGIAALKNSKEDCSLSSIVANYQKLDAAISAPLPPLGDPSLVQQSGKEAMKSMPDTNTNTNTNTDTNTNTNANAKSSPSSEYKTDEEPEPKPEPDEGIYKAPAKTSIESQTSAAGRVKISAAAEKAIKQGFVEIKNPAIQSCTDLKIEAIRKEIGEDKIINYEIYNEAAVQCGFNI